MARAYMNSEPAPLSLGARIYIGLAAALSVYFLAIAAVNWDSPDLFEYGGFLLVAICSSGMRITVPGIS